MGTRLDRNADNSTSANGEYIRAIADFRIPTPVRPSEANRIRVGGRRASDRAWGGFGKNTRHMTPKHKTAMGFAWAAVAAAWFGGLALIALLRSSGVL